MMDEIQHAYVSGQLRRALFVADGRSMLLEADGDAPREALPNEVGMFFSDGVEFEQVGEPGAGRCTLAQVKLALARKTLEMDALDALLGGMDPRFSEKTRRRKIALTHELMADEKIETFVKERVLSVIPPENLDPHTALSFADEHQGRAAAIYSALVTGAPRKVVALLGFGEAGAPYEIPADEASHISDGFCEEGAPRELAGSILSDGNRMFFAGLPELRFRRGTASTTELRDLLEAEWKQLETNTDLHSALSAEGVDVTALLSLSGCPVEVRQKEQGGLSAEVIIIFQVILWTSQGKAIRKGIEETFQRHMAKDASPEWFEKRAAALSNACLRWCHRAIENIRRRRGADAIGSSPSFREK